MPHNDTPGEDVDALCQESGIAFRAYVDRIVPDDRYPADIKKIECPVWGCSECKIGH